MTRKVPAYRKRSNSNTAVLTLMDSVTKQRREYKLGVYNSPESLEMYHNLIAKWEASNRCLPRIVKPDEQDQTGPSVSAVCLEYIRWAKEYYSSRETETIRSAIRILRKYHGTEPANSIGPVKLRALREVVIGSEYDWSRNYTNAQMSRIKRMFKWAASRELIPITTHQSISTLESLKRGRCKARETEKIGSVDPSVVAQTMPFLNHQVAAMVELQLLTGARPGEIVIMRPCDIDRSGDVWIYIPSKHKTEHLNKSRTIYIGPQAQKIIQQFLNRDQYSYLFSPIEAEEDRRKREFEARVTPLSYGNKRGDNKKLNPQKRPGAHYTTNSYMRAIHKACTHAWPIPQGMPIQGKAQWVKDHRWSPNMLRHTASTIIRAKHGLEAAQLMLGHSSAMVTDAVYADRDQTKLMDIARDVG
tara:strand:+ start:114 stop:1361 length:1248 start_codon:yes stop_codon:yes gene_type:complete